MIEKNEFVRQAEFELRKTRTVSEATHQAWENLPAEAKAAFTQAMFFLGSLRKGAAGTPSGPTSEADRVAAARLMLLKLGLDSDDPRWSSDVLDRLLKAVMETPEASVSDLFCALYGVLGDYIADLSKPVAGLIKDLLVGCFTRYRWSYESVDWKSLLRGFSDKATKAQLYLALHAIPPQFIPPQLVDAIAKGLESTAFRDEAASALAV